MNAWLTVIAIGLGTYLIRVIMFLVVGARELPVRITSSMAFVGPAAIGALAATMALTDGAAMTRPAMADLLALIAGFVAVRRTGNVMHAFVVGLPVWWLASAIVLI